jgi:hypothetical protein
MRVRLPIKMYPAVSLPTVRTGGGWRLSTARSGEKPGPSTIRTGAGFRLPTARSH